MPTPVLPADVPQPETAAPDTSWQDMTLPPKDSERNFPTVEREPVTVSSEDIFASLAAHNWRRAAKEIFLLINGTQQAVHGLGFKLHGVDELSPDRREALLVEAERRDQSTLDWPEKLECAAFRSAALLPNGAREQNELVVEHFKQHSQPGDLIFVSSEGAGEPLLAEVFQTAFRSFSARSEMDYQFPFWHVLVNVGEGKLLHMSFKGVHETTWENLLLKHEAYDAVAIGRINAPLETRAQLATEARKFAENRHYNYLWALLSGPVSLMERQAGTEITDTSVTATRSVCLDFATEAARSLRIQGAPLDDDIENAVTPLDLFSASSLKIIDAAALKRAA